MQKGRIYKRGGLVDVPLQSAGNVCGQEGLERPL